MYHVFIKNDKTIYTTFIFNLLQICNVSKHLIRIFSAVMEHDAMEEILQNLGL